MATWLLFLNKLLSFGPKLPAIMASIDIIVGELQNIAEIIQGGLMAAPGDLAAVTIDGEASSPEVLAAEKAVLAACASQGLMASEKFGGVFATLLAFIKANPQLITFLLSLLGK